MPFPDAPEIGGDSYEIDRWFEQIDNYLNSFTGQDSEDECMVVVYKMRRAFWEANPEKPHYSLAGFGMSCAPEGAQEGKAA